MTPQYIFDIYLSNFCSAVFTLVLVIVSQNSRTFVFADFGELQNQVDQIQSEMGDRFDQIEVCILYVLHFGVRKL